MRFAAIAAMCGSVLMANGCSEAPPQESKPVASNQPAKTPEPIAKPSVPQTTHSSPAPLRDAAVSPAAFQQVEGGIPPVHLTSEHTALSKVKVGDALPDASLPQVSGGTSKLSALYGKAATVVVYWKGDRFMTTEVLSDLGPDVVQPFGAKDVKAVGVAVNETAASAGSTIKKTAATFPQLLDADGKAFAGVGAQKFPWVFVLDPSGKIVWFDLEYSHATRRELQQALHALVK